MRPTKLLFKPHSQLPPITPRLQEQLAFGDNPGALRLFAYAPPTFQTHSGLVVMLHGCGQTALGYDLGSGWTDLADELGFVVIAPEQSYANNLNACFNWFGPGDTTRGQGEVASIRAMIAWAMAHYAIDPSRIFITGLSAGGAMTAAMLAAYPEVFAGGAVIAGLPFGGAAHVAEALHQMRHAPEKTPHQWGDLVRAASSHKTHWPRVSVWYGDADATVHISNGEALVSQWLDVHHLHLEDARIEKIGRHTHRSWRTKDGNALVESYTLAGMGHGVPVGGRHAYGQPGPYFLNADISATANIASFWGFPVQQPASQKAKAAPAQTWKTLPGAVGKVIAALKNLPRA